MMNIKMRLDNRYKKFVFNLVASDNILFTAFHQYFYTPKKGSLSFFLDKYSKKNIGLTIVQVGANDGYNRDPFVKFIKRDKWQGILVEPQRYVFETFLKKLYQKSDRITPYNYALDYTNGSRSIYKLSFTNARWATGLTTFNRSVLEKAIDLGHVDWSAEKTGIALPELREDYITEEVIETITAKDLLRKKNIEEIDLLAIDTEGFDYEILKMFDIPVLKPRAIVYENMILSENDKAEATNYLENAGYQTKSIGKDTIAILLNDKDFNILSECFR